MKACAHTTVNDDLSLSLSPGFGFADFEEAEQADAACRVHFITIDSRQVEVKKAEPRKKGTTVAQQDANPYQVSASKQLDFTLYLKRQNFVWLPIKLYSS